MAILKESAMCTPTITTLPTVGEIARRTGAAIHQVEYVIRARNIEPYGWAGNCRVFAESAVAYITSELRRIAAEGRSESGSKALETRGV